MNRTGLTIALAIGFVVGVICAVDPQLDLDISGAVLRSGAPICSTSTPSPGCSTRAKRRAVLITLLVLPAFLAVIGKLILPQRRMLIEGRAALFLIATLALGPGVLTNLILKDHWGRPRPIDVQQFGGDYRFTPWWDPRGDCPNNCSFIAGEPSGAFWTLAPAALAPPELRRWLMARRSPSAPASACCASPPAAHFFSDVVFAGVFMYLLIWLSHGLIYRWPRDPHRRGGVERSRPAGEAGEKLGGAGAAAERPKRQGHLSASPDACARLPRPYSPRAFRAASRLQREVFAMPAGGKKDVKKVVLAYSGGLDTSIILKWLQTTYGCEVVTFTADLGQGEELEPARAKALTLGIKPENIFIEDLREEFVRDYVFPMFRANALYEGQYLLGTSIARPLIAKKQIEIAEKVGADAVAHGATGKGNDQVRFELAYYALKPDVKVIAPWREWDFKSREALLEFRREESDPDRQGQARRSAVLDRRQSSAHLVRRQSAGRPGEAKCRITSIRAPTIRRMRRTRRPISTIDFERGDPVAIDGKKLSPAQLLTAAQRARPQARHRPARSGREPFRRHEVARHVRDAGRHHPACRASRHRIDHARPRRGASQRRADAEICRADL